MSSLQICQVFAARVALHLVFPFCVYPRFDGTSQPSYAFHLPSGTHAGAAVAALAARHPKDSGLFLLEKGIDALAARLAVVDEAERAVDAQYYMFHDDATGGVLLESMLRAADRGVRVRLLIDDLGSDGSDRMLAAANGHPNLEVRLFNPRARGPWNRLAKTIDTIRRPLRINHRMHNKMLASDGIIGVVGGRNIGDEYFDAAEGVNFADLDLLAFGPVGAALGGEFDKYWNSEFTKRLEGWGAFERGGEDLTKLRSELGRRLENARGTAYCERLRERNFVKGVLNGDPPAIWAPIEVHSDEPSKVVAGRDEVQSTLLVTKLKAAFPDAQQDLLVVSPYFIPGRSGVELLTAAVARGARVRVLTNSLAATDVSAVHAGYRKYRRDLLEGGVELYEIQPSGDALLKGYRRGLFGSQSASLHAKTFIADGRHVFVGSLNLDPRSVHLNTELGVVVESAELARQLTDKIERVLAPSASWSLSLECGDLVWRGARDGEQVEFDVDPGTSWWSRYTTWCLGLLPLEGQL